VRFQLLLSQFWHGLSSLAPAIQPCRGMASLEGFSVPSKGGVTYSRPKAGTRMPSRNAFSTPLAGACIKQPSLSTRFLVSLWTVADGYANLLFSSLLRSVL